MKYIKTRLNKYDNKSKKLLFQVCVLHPCSVLFDDCFVVFLFYLITCVRVCL